MAKQKKRGGRVTPKKVAFCRNNPGKPCSFTSRKRTKVDGVWGEWVNNCSYCFRKEP